MKTIILAAAIAFAATPALAQSVAGASTTRVTPAEARPTAGPVVRIPKPDGPTRADVAEHLRKVYQRAQNAVDNGASPERVRAKVQEHKQKIRERWNASHGD